MDDHRANASSNSAKARAALPLGVTIDHPIDLDRYLPYKLYRLSAITARRHTVTFPSGVTIRTREWRVLLILASNGPASGSEVARLSFMDTGSVARSVKELLRAELIVSRPDLLDKRKQVLTLSAEGAKIYDTIASERLSYVNELLDPLDPGERVALFSLFDKLDRQAALLAMPAHDPFAREDGTS